MTRRRELAAGALGWGAAVLVGWAAWAWALPLHQIIRIPITISTY